MTFEKFADAVLEAAPEPVRPMSRLMKRQLVRQLLDEQLAGNRLKHFGPIARTGGLVDLVCEFISELKRLEIWPEAFRKACEARGITDKDVELLEIYDRYQQSLGEHQLYDPEGRFWSARHLLQQGQRRPLENLRLVVADGFTDFTRTQHEILSILGGRVDEMLVSLPLEPEPRRYDLFTKPINTLAGLQHWHRSVELVELGRTENPPWPAMAHLEKRLFTNPRQAVTADDTGGIEILAAARPIGEIELIGARVKRLLGDGTARPGQIAVVFRTPQDADSPVAEVFSAMGIPFTLELGQTLERSPALAALVALLQLDGEDWPFVALSAVLGSNYFKPHWPEWQQGQAAMAAERVVRELQIPRGRRRLLKELREKSESNGGGESQYGTVLAALERLGNVLDELPKKTVPGDWAKAWQRLAEQTGLVRAIHQEEPAEQEGDTTAHVGLPDRAAWQRLMMLVGEGDCLARWLGQHPPQWDRRDALAALVDLLGSERIGHGGDEAGHVRVLSAASVRAITVPYLFLAGLSEKAFPPPDREDRLYSEAESQRLIAEGLPLVARTERNREEMLLFYEAMTRATQRLYLSYPALDDAGQPLSPSPYLAEVEQACGEGKIARTEATDLSPVPVDDEPLSPAEFRLKATALALEGDLPLLAGLVHRAPAMAENLRRGLELTRLRQDRDRFGLSEGMLLSDAVRAVLAERYPQERTFSATELEQYATCPYQFFMERLLKVKPLEEIALAVDHLERGRLAHDVMAALHRRVNETLGHPGSPLELEPGDYERLLDETLRDTLGPEPSNPIRAAFREVDRRLLVQWTDAYRDQHARYDKLWRSCDEPPVPTFFEVAFGGLRADDGPPSTERPLEFPVLEGTVRLAGRIDRIDVGRVAGRRIFSVLDYKTGASIRLTAETIAAGKTLQLPIYAVAAAQLLLGDNALPWQAGYWYLRDDGFKPRSALVMHRQEESGVVAEPEWEEIRRLLGETIGSLVRGIRLGQFPVCSKDERCTGFCPYRTVCRINQVRSLEKTWQPPKAQE